MSNPAPPHTEVTIPGPRPNCDLCKARGVDEPALYDAATHQGSWGYLCQKHFTAHGVGLGLGRGQKLIIAGESGEAE